MTQAERDAQRFRRECDEMPAVICLGYFVCAAVLSVAIVFCVVVGVVWLAS